jgi:NAD(P)-dependent dehydrogenase (short-subunit alcohol dehydrogenase family)
MRLRDKVAIITGGAQGIGKATALRMAEEGAAVVIADINQEEAESVVKQIQSTKGKALFLRCDVGSTSDVQALIERAVTEYGRIDILHNNAGIDYSAPFTEMDEAAWQRVLNTNLTSVFRGCRYAVPHMIRNGGGAIINTASLQAFLGFNHYAAYAAAKGAILSMTIQLAVELAPHKIRVNSVSPGAILTPMTALEIARAADPAELTRQISGQHAMNRIGYPSEVADAVVFLASGESSFITGVDIKVDGGMAIYPGRSAG